MKTESTLIKEGDVLIVSKPFVSVLKSKLRTERCDYCFTRDKLLKCTGCQYVYYCNYECQKTAWIDHKGECKNLKRVSPRIIPDAARVMARIILKLKRGGGQETGHYSKTGLRMFKDLMSHYSDIKKDKNRMEHFDSLCGVLNEFLGPDIMPNAADLMGIYGRMCVNGFNILDPEMMPIGTGIYLGASIIDHSCDPNAVAVFEGTTLFIHSLIQFTGPVDWTKVFISYIDLLNEPYDRQQDLRGTYYFLCECRRCIDADELALMRSMLCSNSECGDAVNVNRQKDTENEDDSTQGLSCSKCKSHIKDDCYQKYNEVTEFTKMHLQSMKDVAYLDVCKICLKRQEGILHPMNILHVKTLDLAFESAIEMSQWENAKKFGTLAIPGYRRYYGKYHPLYGILLLKLGKINIFLETFKEASTHLEEAERVIRVTHGKDHSLYRSELMPLMFQARTALHCET